MQFIFLLFILVPIVEIVVFIQVGDILGLSVTLLIVLITAIIGVNLLKQQGLKAWRDIQHKMVSGQVPALEMASAAQLLFAGGLLLTPGFVTDAIGFALMVPAIRLFIAKQLSQSWATKMTANHNASASQRKNSFEAHFYSSQGFNNSENYTNPENETKHNSHNHSRIIEGEFEEKRTEQPKDNNKIS